MAAMRIFLAALSAAILSLLAMLPAEAQQGIGVPQIEQYFNGILSLKAIFVQSNPNASEEQGTHYVRRPGRMLF
jgi:outer membrane lipoprotein-sorting protein